MSSPEVNNTHLVEPPADSFHNTTAGANMSFNVAHEDTQPQANMQQSIVTLDTDSGSKQTLFSASQHQAH